MDEQNGVLHLYFLSTQGDAVVSSAVRRRKWWWIRRQMLKISIRWSCNTRKAATTTQRTEHKVWVERGRRSRRIHPTAHSALLPIHNLLSILPLASSLSPFSWEYTYLYILLRHIHKHWGESIFHTECYFYIEPRTMPFCRMQNKHAQKHAYHCLDWQNRNGNSERIYIRNENSLKAHDPPSCQTQTIAAFSDSLSAHRALAV